MLQANKYTQIPIVFTYPNILTVIISEWGDY